MEHKFFQHLRGVNGIFYYAGTISRSLLDSTRTYRLFSLRASSLLASFRGCSLIASAAGHYSYPWSRSWHGMRLRRHVWPCSADRLQNQHCAFL